MPLFKCTQCGTVENTGCGDYWYPRCKGLPVKCSECATGTWHNRFPKEPADEAHGWFPDPKQPHFLVHRAPNHTKGEG